MMSNQHHPNKEDGSLKNASKTVDQTQRADDGEQLQDQRNLPTGEDHISQEKDETAEYPYLVPVEGQEDYESPQKCFDLSQARAMFMPHLVPAGGIDAVDS